MAGFLRIAWQLCTGLGGRNHRNTHESKEVIKRGFDDTEPARQRYECHDCDKRFDDLTDTIFAGHHQPLKVWILCLYFMGLNLSNEQIAHELSVNESDAYQMTAQLRDGIVKKSPQ